MSLDELLKGLAVFNDGLKSFAVSKGVNDANDKLKEINMAEQQKLVEAEQALGMKNQVSTELGMRLTGAGADAATIATAREAISPSLGAQYQAGQNKELQASSQGFTAEQSEKQRAHELELERMRLAATKVKLSGKFDEKQVGFLMKTQERFDKDAKLATDSLESIRLAEDSINANNPIGDAAVVNFMARASGEKGPLTETDKEPFGGSQAYDQKVKRLAVKAKTGKMTESDRELVKQLVSTYKIAQYRNIMADRNKHAARAARNAEVGGYGLTQDQIAESMFEIPADVRAEIEKRDKAPKKASAKPGSAAPDTAQAPSAQEAEKTRLAMMTRFQAFLDSPEAKQNPQQATRVEAALRKLKAATPKE